MAVVVVVVEEEEVVAEEEAEDLEEEEVVVVVVVTEEEVAVVDLPEMVTGHVPTVIVGTTILPGETVVTDVTQPDQKEWEVEMAVVGDGVEEGLVVEEVEIEDEEEVDLVEIEVDEEDSVVAEGVVVMEEIEVDVVVEAEEVVDLEEEETVEVDETDLVVIEVTEDQSHTKSLDIDLKMTVIVVHILSLLLCFYHHEDLPAIVIKHHSVILKIS